MPGSTLLPPQPDDALDPASILALLRTLLAGAPSGFGLSSAERDAIDPACGKGSAIYGELEDDAALSLLRALKLGPDDVFVDLGSGTGRIPLLAACGTTVGGAVGVELARPRHEVAVGLPDDLLAQLPAVDRARYAQRVEFRHADLRSVDLSDATVIYAGATCFSDPMMASLCRHVRDSAPRLRRLAATRPLPAPFDRSFPPVAEVHLAASWSPRVRIHVHAAPSF